MRAALGCRGGPPHCKRWPSHKVWSATRARQGGGGALPSPRLLVWPALWRDLCLLVWPARGRDLRLLDWPALWRNL